MELTPDVFEQLKADLAKAKTCGDLMGKVLTLHFLYYEAMLEAELTEELGY